MIQVGAWLPRDGGRELFDSTYTSDVAAGHENTGGPADGKYADKRRGSQAKSPGCLFPDSPCARPPVRLLRRLLLLRLPRGEPDDLNSRATSHVHCLDHI